MNHQIPFAEAFRFRARPGFISFGEPMTLRKKMSWIGAISEVR
jgi:hypothetical protein